MRALPLLAGPRAIFWADGFPICWLKRTGNIGWRGGPSGSPGFAARGGSIVPATLTDDPLTSVLFSCLAVFGLELTVGVSWALATGYRRGVRRLGFFRHEHMRQHRRSDLARFARLYRAEVWLERAVSGGLVSVCWSPLCSIFENRCQPHSYLRKLYDN